ARGGIHLKIDDREIKLVDRFLFDKQSKAFRKEVLEIDGKEVDTGAGRLFLVDLTVSPPRVGQRKTDLPPDAPEGPTTADVEAAGTKILGGLAPRDGEVSNFVRSASGGAGPKK